MHLASTLKTETCVSGGSAPIPLQSEHVGVGDISECGKAPPAMVSEGPAEEGIHGSPPGQGLV